MSFGDIFKKNLNLLSSFETLVALVSPETLFATRAEKRG
jgi:hypothetical protein